MSRFALQRQALERLRQARARATAPPPHPRTGRPARPAAAPDQPHPVPLTLRNAAEWSWRFLLVAAAVLVILKGVTILSQIVVPVLVALLLTALLQPLFVGLARVLPRTLAAGLTVLALLLVLSGAFTVIGRTLSDGFGDVTEQVLQGIEEVRAWVRDTFGITNVQLDEYIDQARESVTTNAGEGIGPMLTTVGLTAGHFIAGFFIALFTLFFFLHDGPRIWSWLIRFFPRPTRTGLDEAGHIAWGQLSTFTRATVIVALVDAVGITLVAVLLDVPFPAIIFLLVFLGSFIPVIGASISGAVAVLLALVAQGPITALLMLAGVIAVQQIEAHLLQPMLLGRVMKLHPLAVILAIAAGVVLAGITGALIAVPVVAVLNAVGKYYFADEDVTASDDGLLDPDAVTDLPPERQSPAESTAVGGDD